jgi:hypothetical protein
MERSGFEARIFILDSDAIRVSRFSMKLQLAMMKLLGAEQNTPSNLEFVFTRLDVHGVTLRKSTGHCDTLAD